MTGEWTAERAAHMAIYHLSMKLVSRGGGRSSTAAAAYRAADRVVDTHVGLVFDYSRKLGVEHSEIVLPAASGDAAWARNRQQLWNAAEAAENRKDARVAREYEVALPHELNARQRIDLVRAFAQELVERHGCAVDIAIHAPHREGDTRNHHAHLLATTRAVTAGGLLAKTDIELKDADRAKRGLPPARNEVVTIRERWATLVNEHLAEHGYAARIDHRSLEAQGMEREATYHKGPAVNAIERRGERSPVADRIREDISDRLQRAAEAGRLERESKEIARSIIDTSADLKAAIADRDTDLGRSVEAARQSAQAAWLALRSSSAAAPPLDGTRQAYATPTLDITRDLAAVRREGRDSWLTHRDEQAETHAPGKSAEKRTGLFISNDVRSAD